MTDVWQQSQHTHPKLVCVSGCQRPDTIVYIVIMQSKQSLIPKRAKVYFYYLLRYGWTGFR